MRGFTPHARLAAAGFAIFLMIGAVQALYGPSLPSIRHEFGLTSATAGWVIGAHYLGAVSGVFLSLVLERRLSVSARLTAGSLLLAAGSAAFALIPVWPLALIGTCCIGLGYGILGVVVNSLFASGFGEGNPAMLILVNAFFGLGAVVGPLLYGLLSSGHFRPAFLAVALLGVLLLPLAWSVEDVRPEQAVLPTPDVNTLPVGLLAFVALFLLYTGLESDTSGWMATHLIHHGYSQATAAGLTSAFWVAFTIGRVLSVPVSLRITPIRMILGGLTGVIVLSLAARLGAMLPVIYILIGLMLSPIFPVGFAWMDQELRGLRSTAAMALLGALAGGLIFPVIVGGVIGATSADALPLALIAIAIASMLVVSGIPRVMQATRPLPVPAAGIPPSRSLRGRERGNIPRDTPDRQA